MTTPLLEKSKQNMLIAENLIKQNQYSSTINRAYYSCLQFILHILIEKLGHSHEDLKKQPRVGTHSQAQYLLESTLVLKVGNNKKDYKWFQAKFPEFKQERVIADYYGDTMDAGRGHDAINHAKAIMTTLKKYY